MYIKFPVWLQALALQSVTSCARFVQRLPPAASKENVVERITRTTIGRIRLASKIKRCGAKSM
jgi:hypothetical protein